jgi:hypothetical protein
MVRRGFLFAAALVLLLPSALPCGALNILLWKKSGAAEFSNPDVAAPAQAGRVQCDYGIGKALTENGHSYTTVAALPEDLAAYDVVFLTLGFAFLEAG